MNQNSAQNQKRKEDESKFSSKSVKKKKMNQNSAQNQKRKENEPKLSSKSEKKRR